MKEMPAVSADRYLRSEVKEYPGEWVAARDEGWHEVNDLRSHWWTVVAHHANRRAVLAAVYRLGSHDDVTVMYVPRDWKPACVELAEAVTTGVWVKHEPALPGGAKVAQFFDTRTPEQRRKMGF